MIYVYLLQSQSSPGQRYIGLTTNLKKRLADHNVGKSRHTSKFLPWRLITYVAFSDYAKATAGHAFARRHLW
jgi:putative endonuclease